MATGGRGGEKLVRRLEATDSKRDAVTARGVFVLLGLA